MEIVKLNTPIINLIFLYLGHAALPVLILHYIGVYI